jgi:perosamine synthetase
MTSMQAALGIGSLHAISDSLAQKTHMAQLYTAGLKGLPVLTLPVVRDWATHVYWMYAILIDEKVLGMSKNQFRAKLLAKGIDTRDFFYAPIDQPLLQGQALQDHFPVTEHIAQTGCYLPSGLAITDDQIKTVCEVIKSICRA